MKIKYLGTGASEGIPAVFCNCKTCKDAKLLGGKNYRTRSQLLINENLIIDVPPDTYMHMLNYKLDLSKVKYFALTHSHSDHCDPFDFKQKRKWLAHEMVEKDTVVYCNQAVKNVFENVLGENLIPGMTINVIENFKPYYFKDYTLIAFPTNHMSNEDARLYLISQNNKTVLYLHDTGLIEFEIIEYLKANKIYIDLVSLDCTHGFSMEIGDLAHMCVNDTIIVKNWLLENKICDTNTKFVLNHFSHNNGKNHDELVNLINPLGFIVAFDGLTIDL